jgi:hypothetical protein
MSSTFNGSALQTRFVQKFGFSDSTSLARVIEWMNEIQDDLTAGKKLPFLKFKMKKYIAADAQDVDLSPEIPAAPTTALAAGGSLTDATDYYVKVTFVLFDEAGNEFSSIESEPSAAGTLRTTTTGNQTISLTGIPVYSGSTSVKPTTIYRRVYLKKGTAAYFLYSTITDNTTTTLSVTADTTSTIEPPEYSMVDMMSGEDPTNEAVGLNLREEKLDDILKYNPGLTSTGNAAYYARSGKRKIFLYPRPSAAFTLTYWVYRVPSRIFADTDRAIQLDHAFKKVLDAGVTWKGLEYKDFDGQETKLSNYEQLKSAAIATYRETGGQAPTVKAVW